MNSNASVFTLLTNVFSMQSCDGILTLQDGSMIDVTKVLGLETSPLDNSMNVKYINNDNEEHQVKLSDIKAVVPSYKTIELTSFKKGNLILNDGKILSVDRVLNINFDEIIVQLEDGMYENIIISDIKDIRPLSLDSELPTKRDEAPLDEVKEEDSKGEFKGDIKEDEEINPFFAHKKLTKRSIKKKIILPKFSLSSFDKKRKLNDNSTIKLSSDEDDTVTELKEEITRLKNENKELSNTIRDNILSSIRDSLNNNYPIKITLKNGECNEYTVVYIYSNVALNKDTVIVKSGESTSHVEVDDISYISPVITSSDEKKFYDLPPFDIMKYLKFEETEIHGENVLVNNDLGIVVSKEKDGYYLQGVYGPDIRDMVDWIKKCGIKTYNSLHNYSESCDDEEEYDSEEETEDDYTDSEDDESEELQSDEEDTESEEDESVYTDSYLFDYLNKRITVTYKGETRDIIPLFIKDEEYVIAKCMRDNKVKRFSYDKLVFTYLPPINDTEKEIEEESGCECDKILNDSLNKRITITYKGEDRDIIPLSNDEDKSYITAKCMRDNKVKRFSKNKLIIIPQTPIKKRNNNEEDEKMLWAPKKQTPILSNIINALFDLKQASLDVIVNRIFYSSGGLRAEIERKVIEELKRSVDEGRIIRVKNYYTLPKIEAQRHLNFDISDTLNSAIINKHSVLIKYNGGTYSNIERSIKPISIVHSKGKSYVEAICDIDNTVKRFSLDKIRLV